MKKYLLLLLSMLFAAPFAHAQTTDRVLVENSDLEADADGDFEAGSILDLDIDGETADLLAVSGTVTGTATIPVAQDQATGEWRIMTAGSFDADFVSTNPRWSLSKRNGGTELWLTKKLATTIVIK